MLRWFALSSLALTATAGCSAATSTRSAPDTSTTTQSSAAPQETLPATPSAASVRPKTSCQAFHVFYTDLTTQTPHAVALLTRDAQQVRRLASGAHMTGMADRLVSAVTAPSWDSSGNVYSPSVQALYDACY